MHIVAAPPHELMDSRALAPRIASVDVFRVLAVLAVVAIHTTPFEMPGRRIGSALDLATLVNQATRFAVPTFFVLAGYFWAAKVAAVGAVGPTTRQLLRRIGIVWVAWSALYLLPVNLADALGHGAAGPLKVVYWNVSRLAEQPLLAVLEGTRHHLWFLVALMMAVAVSAACLAHGRLAALPALAVVSYAAGLLGQAYADAPFALHFPPALRNGHPYALAFFATGVGLHRRPPTRRWLAFGALLATGGWLMHVAEVTLIHRLWGSPLEHDYVASTYLFGLGTSLMALSRAQVLAWPRVAAIGPFVLGIYAAHLAFVELLQPLERRFAGGVAWDLAFVALVFILSYALARGLARWPVTRRLVT
ncbi:MAG: acyltransferase [Rubrivivax sp.]|nr:acyltransferase [Rubrivivax sp.]